MMRDLSRVVSDLVAIRAELDAVPAANSTRRLELAQVLDRLRIEAKQIRDTAYPREMARQWRAELAELLSVWDRVASERIDVVKQAGGGSHGGDFGFTADAMRINRVIDADRGRVGIEARVKELRILLEGLDSAG